MKINEYQSAAMRTANSLSNSEQLCNAALGLTGEAGEVADIVKKALYQGHEIDREHIAKELGDVCWYVAVCATAVGYDLETIMQMNVNKLLNRYPDGFDSSKSVNRAEGDI